VIDDEHATYKDIEKMAKLFLKRRMTQGRKKKPHLNYEVSAANTTHPPTHPYINTLR
jgi:hypothetical protein